MAFKPYCEGRALNITDAGHAATSSPPPDSRYISAFSRSGVIGWMLVLVGSFLLTFAAAAQTVRTGQSAAASKSGKAARETTFKSASATTTHPLRRKAHHRKPRAAHAKAPVQAVAPVAPPPPLPPAQQAARPAKIEFAGGKLRINAQNSSLVQILTQISRQTGIVIEGLNRDQRIYGEYGPGSVSGTLTKLLDGSGYDYVIVGGGPGKPPAKLLLTPGGGATAPVAQTASEPTVSAGGASVMANPSEPTHPKTSQEIFEEMRRMHPPH